MFKILVAAAALTAAVVTTAPAQAKTNIDFNLGIGVGVGGYYGGGYYGGGYYPVYGGYYDGISCWKAKKIVQNHGFYKVYAIDCQGKHMRFKAKKKGTPVIVTVNRWGNIVGVNYI
ncbi:hypothetical protein [Taklimakanibacter deserti]|uniref:hypothetical protein n=1 Tax=Taklimakanibacter deserti TaxID=2267839 RepID=UPI000E64FCB7